eukprot:scaffold13468_cov66-Cyclotella_meneghiniana.AAC.3
MRRGLVDIGREVVELNFKIGHLSADLAKFISQPNFSTSWRLTEAEKLGCKKKVARIHSKFDRGA